MNKLFQNLPKEWQLSKIGNYTTKVEYGISKSMNLEKVGVPILRMNNLNGQGYIDYTDLKYVDITEDMVKKFSLEKDDILFNRVNSVELVGKTSIVKDVIRNMVFASYLIRVNVNNEKLLPDYLNYYLNSYLGSIEINRNLRRASSQANINAKEIKLMRIIIPPIAEQFKITSILSNLDIIIKKTSTSINILQILKKGLMQRLFTEGIGHTEFKETRLGNIPKEWEIIKIGELAVKMKSGGTPLTRIKEYYEKGEIPFAKIQDLSSARKYLNNTQIKITKEGINNSNAWIVPKNSWLFAIYGSLGVQAINKIEVSTNQAILGIILDQNLGLPEFYYYWFEYWNNQLQRYAITTTQPNLSKQIFEKLKVVKPNIEEQKVITAILSSTDDIIEKEIIYMKKLKIIKKGLMQDLLTGKKRVRIN